MPASLFYLPATCFFITTAQRRGLQFNEYFDINPKVGSAYALGVDGLSVPMVVLATLLTSMALLASSSIAVGVKGYHISILLTEFDMLGVFLAQDGLSSISSGKLP